jgi:TonB-like protein
MRKLGGSEALIPPEEQAAQEQALARAESFERFLAVMRVAREKRAGWLPLDEAYAEVRQWFEMDPDLPAGMQMRVLRAMLARFAGAPADLRRRAMLLRLGSLLRSEGREREALAAFEEAGLAADMCLRLAEPPNVVSHPIDDRSYPPDALSHALQGTSVVEFDVDSEGGIAGHRIILSAPALIFDAVVAAELPGFRLTPPKSGGRGRRCRAYVQSIHWRAPPETEIGLPSFLEPDPDGT